MIPRPFLIKETYPPTFLDKSLELREKRGFIAKGFARDEARKVAFSASSRRRTIKVMTYANGRDPKGARSAAPQALARRGEA